MGAVLVDKLRISMILLSMSIGSGIACTSDTRGEEMPWGLDDPDTSAHEVVRDLWSAPADMQDRVDMKDSRVQGEPCQVPGQKGRCAIGRWLTRHDELVCTQLYRPMPEICNSEDSDCDGIVDYGDEDTPYTLEILMQRHETFEQLRQVLIDQGVDARRIDDLRALKACQDYGICLTSPTFEEDPVQKPFDNVRDEFDAFHERASGIDRTCY